MQLTHEANQLMDAFIGRSPVIRIATWRAASKIHTLPPRHVSGIVEKGLLSQEAKAFDRLELPKPIALGYQERSPLEMLIRSKLKKLQVR
jgi:hypothetical protein